MEVTRWHGYPINLGGRPFNSWRPSFPITFELNGAVRFDHCHRRYAGAETGCRSRTILFFNVPEFERASTDRFFSVHRSA